MDLNDTTETGFYYVPPGTTNAPTDEGCILMSHAFKPVGPPPPHRSLPRLVWGLLRRRKRPAYNGPVLPGYVVHDVTSMQGEETTIWRRHRSGDEDWSAWVRTVSGPDA